MSAQSLLSVIAPAAPTLPTGAPAVDASGFEGMLAAMMGAEPVAEGETPAPASDKFAGTKAADAIASGFLVAPILMPAPPPVAAPIVAAPQGETLATDTIDFPFIAAPTVEQPPAAAQGDVDDATPAEDQSILADAVVATDVPIKTDASPALPTTAPVAAPAPAPAPVAKAETRPVEPAPMPAKQMSTKVGDQPATLPPAPSDQAAAEAPTPETAPAKIAAAPSDISRTDATRAEAAKQTVAALPVQAPTPQAAPAPAEKAAPPVPPQATAPVAAAATAPADDVAVAAAAVQTTEAVKAAAKSTAEEPAPEAQPAATPLPSRAGAPAPQTDRPTNASRGKAAASDDNSAKAAPADARPVSTDRPAPDASAEPVTLIRAPEPAAAAPVAAMPQDAAPTDAPPQGAAPEQASVVVEHGPIDKPTLSQLSRVAVEATAQIAAQIVRKLEGRSTTFEMALTPDELGRVDVKLDIDSDGRLTARLAFDNPLAATDLRGRAEDLRRQLEQAGFQLADNALEFAERDNSSSAFDRGHDGRNQGRAFANASRVNAEADAAPPARWISLSLSPSGVDLKV
ncbi:flagellar hook-length control protein FliK [Brevundimonas lenta]|uniref:Flagellar hook-length control protein-like C-terminal domain-containing protein n=1 Tax=Brevundimonas lenta TaxID=424796 RepID=A0A7W6JEH7_9CAUL|nr:flagellar hook-length control protein FliK [Brevundimonas lenta]MBB4083665.1 hypothetical protein [Brevundimonas lenta]